MRSVHCITVSAMFVHPFVQLGVLLTLGCSLFSLPIVNAADIYNAIDGYLCIKSGYVETLPESYSRLMCSAVCSMRARCQAFTTADGLCQLFVFDECSKSVKDCTCSRRGKLFVKQRAGVGSGQLCPSGYGDDLCGVKYKVYSGSFTWNQGRQKCDSQSGLVIMADVIDTAEMNQVETVYSKYSSGSNMWLGGLQKPGSSEPSGGWYWVGCNITLAAGLWGSGEPNNGDGLENAIGRWSVQQKLNDYSDSLAMPSVLCECASPF